MVVQSSREVDAMVDNKTTWNVEYGDYYLGDGFWRQPTPLPSALRLAPHASSKTLSRRHGSSVFLCTTSVQSR